MRNLETDIRLRYASSEPPFEDDESGSRSPRSSPSDDDRSRSPDEDEDDDRSPPSRSPEDDDDRGSGDEERSEPPDFSHFMKCMKHFYRQGHAKHFASKYGVAPGGGAEAEDDVDPRDVSAPAPGRDDANIPGPERDTPQEPGRMRRRDQERLRRQGQNMKETRFQQEVLRELAQLRKKVETVTEENRDLRYERDVAACEALLTTIQAEGYQLEPEIEVERMLPMNEEQRRKHLKYIRRNYARDPAGNPRMAPLKDDRPRLNRERQGRPGEQKEVVRVRGGSEGRRSEAQDDGEGLPAEDTDKVLAYMRLHGLNGPEGWDKAKRTVLGNGHDRNGED